MIRVRPFTFYYYTLGWLPGLVTGVGYRGWLPGLVTGVGYRGWLPGLGMPMTRYHHLHQPLYYYLPKRPKAP
jgi:hypothetical protein